MLDSFDHRPTRRGTGSVKWEKYPPDVLPMWVADMDFASPQPVIQALLERTRQGIFGYPADNHELKEEIVAWISARYAWKVIPDEIVFLPGVATGFNLAAHALAAPGKGVLVQPPVYHPILNMAKTTGALPQEAALFEDKDGKYHIAMDALEEAANEQTKLFVLCNPHNPVGRVYRRDELLNLAEFSLRHGLTICSDEIHCDLVYSENRHIPIASLDSEIAAHTITLMAPSKTFNMPGLKLSFCVIQNAELRERYLAARRGLVGWVNIIGQVAALAAYRAGAGWLTELLKYLETNRDVLADFVKKNLPGISMAKPEGTYLAWLDCRKAAIAGDPYTFFLENARVALNDGRIFGKEGEGFVRLNFGCPREMLQEALERMAKSLEKITYPESLRSSARTPQRPEENRNSQ